MGGKRQLQSWEKYVDYTYVSLSNDCCVIDRVQKVLREGLYPLLREIRKEALKHLFLAFRRVKHSFCHGCHSYSSRSLHSLRVRLEQSEKTIQPQPIFPAPAVVLITNARLLLTLHLQLHPCFCLICSTRNSFILKEYCSRVLWNLQGRLFYWTPFQNSWLTYWNCYKEKFGIWYPGEFSH